MSQIHALPRTRHTDRGAEIVGPLLYSARSGGGGELLVAAGVRTGSGQRTPGDLLVLDEVT